MKIKFLLVPGAIIVSIVLMIWNIWPAWFASDLDNSIKNLRSDIKNDQLEIAKIKNRKNNIDLLNAELKKDSGNKNLIFNYYPVIRKEEDVVNKINHIALGSGVFLTEVSVEYGKVDEQNSSEKVLAINKKDEASTVLNEEEYLSNGGNTSLNEEDILAGQSGSNSSPAFITAKISIYGDYPQIKEFFASLYATGLLNNIRSVSISKEKAQGAEGDVSSDGRLSAEATVSFGYMKKKNDPVIGLMDNPLFSSGKFDLGLLNEKKSLILEKYPNSEVGETGTANPFIP